MKKTKTKTKTKCAAPQGECVAPTVCKAVSGCAAEAILNEDGAPKSKPGDRTKPAPGPKPRY